MKQQYICERAGQGDCAGCKHITAHCEESQEECATEPVHCNYVKARVVCIPIEIPTDPEQLTGDGA